MDFFGGADFFRGAAFGVGGLRASLTALPAWNRTTLLAAIWMVSAVCGFRPSRAGRAATFLDNARRSPEGIVTETGSGAAGYPIECRHGPLIYRRHRFPPEIIRHAIWLYLRFTLSYRDVEELLAKRGLDISYETVRRWVLKFGPIIAGRLRQRRSRPNNRWHLDEMVVRIAGERLYLWRAVDDEGEVLDMLVQRRRDTRSALPYPPITSLSFFASSSR